MAPERPGYVMFPTSTRISSIPIFLLSPPIGGCRQPSFSGTPSFYHSEIDENQIDGRSSSRHRLKEVGYDFDESSATRAYRKYQAAKLANIKSELHPSLSAGVPVLMVTLNWPLPLFSGPRPSSGYFWVDAMCFQGGAEQRCFL
ncbi:hypothetical protein QIS74_04482 [Colletotrichum tabaci]|uniref:Uncharacterized protein n=1 Tax=Colletotrichum tabaci TaxID=1209068 RepID=A0AAV9TIR7_9PEZI